MKSVIKRYRLELIQESAKRYDCERKGICKPEQAANAFEEVFGMTRLTEEHLTMFCLDSKNNVIAAHVVAQGALSEAVIHPREVYKRAVLSNAVRLPTERRQPIPRHRLTPSLVLSSLNAPHHAIAP